MHSHRHRRAVPGLAAASRRADREGIANRAWAIVAGGDRLPLRPASVDAAIHTDVLCCLRPKLATLRATRGVLRPGGRTAFSVIFPTPGLSDAQARRAIEAGPPECELHTTYPNLLRSAGFVDVDEHDVTPDYLATARRKLEETERFAAGMVEALGPQEFEETQAKRRLAIRAIADGLLRRSVFVARRDPAATARRSRAAAMQGFGRRRLLRAGESTGLEVGDGSLRAAAGSPPLAAS